MLARLIKPTSGKLLLDGRPVPTGGRGRRATRARCRWCCRTRSPRSTPCTTCGTTWPGRSRCTAGRRRAPAWTRRSPALLERVALTPAEQFLRKYPHELSGGPAAAGGDRPGARGAAAGAAGRRAGVDAGRLHPARRPQPARRPARAGAAGDPLHHPRHRLGPVPGRRDRGDVRRARWSSPGPAEAVTDQPAHPYTQLLLSAAPDPDRAGPRPALRGRGAPPSLVDAAAGLPVPPALPARDGDLRRRRAAQVRRGAPATSSACWLHASDLDAAQASPIAARQATRPRPTHPTRERRRLDSRVADT